MIAQLVLLANIFQPETHVDQNLSGHPFLFA